MIADQLRVSVDGWSAIASWRPAPDAAGCFWDLQEIDGWFGGLAVRADTEDRTGADGAFDGAPYFTGRTVALKGNLSAPDEPALLAGMNRIAAVLGARRTGTLLVEELARGVTRQSGCRLDVQGRARRTGRRSAEWEIALFCPDPLRYGPLLERSTGLPQSGDGLTWPLFSDGYLDWGEPGDPGQMTLTNTGTAAAPVLLKVTGPHPAGFELSAGGDRLTYAAAVPEQQTIWLDTGAGSVRAEGTADRQTAMVRSDWLLVPARDPETGVPGSLTIQYTDLAGDYHAGARAVAQWREAET